jgi:hypothetical protein
MTTGRILYDSRFRDAGVVLSYEAAEVEGFEKENAVDWRDFSLFRLATGGNFFDATLAADGDIDTFCYYIKKPVNGDYTFKLFYESAPAVFTELTEIDTAIDPLIGMKTFDKVTVLAGRRIVVPFIDVVATEDVRQLTVGVRLDFPIGQHQGIRPPNLRGEFVQSNNISVNGSFIGRDKVRGNIRGEIALEFLNPTTFVRDQWLDLMEHAERFAYFYAWDLDTYPDEVVFSWALSTPRPINSGPANKMSVSLPWSALAT